MDTITSSRHIVLAYVKGYLKNAVPSVLSQEVEKAYSDCFRVLRKMMPSASNETGLRLEHLCGIAAALSKPISISLFCRTLIQFGTRSKDRSLFIAKQRAALKARLGRDSSSSNTESSSDSSSDSDSSSSSDSSPSKEEEAMKPVALDFGAEKEVSPALGGAPKRKTDDSIKPPPPPPSTSASKELNLVQNALSSATSKAKTSLKRPLLRREAMGSAGSPTAKLAKTDDAKILKSALLNKSFSPKGKIRPILADMLLPGGFTAREFFGFLQRAFWLLLRPDEWDLTSASIRTDLSQREYVSCAVERSKSDVFGFGWCTDMECICDANDPIISGCKICPVHGTDEKAWQRMKKESSVAQRGAAFTQLVLLSFEEDGLSILRSTHLLHLCRIGGAQTMADCKETTRQIQCAGRWASEDTAIHYQKDALSAPSLLSLQRWPTRTPLAIGGVGQAAIDLFSKDPGNAIKETRKWR
jgi:hypothetical protein